MPEASFPEVLTIDIPRSLEHAMIGDFVRRRVDGATLQVVRINPATREIGLMVVGVAFPSSPRIGLF